MQKDFEIVFYGIAHFVGLHYIFLTDAFCSGLRNADLDPTSLFDGLIFSYFEKKKTFFL